MTYLLVTLPAIAFFAIWSLVTIHRDLLGLSRLSARGTFVIAFVGFEALLLAITEVLSVGDQLTSVNTALAWLLADIALGSLLLFVDRRRLGSQLRGMSPAAVSAAAAQQPRLVVYGIGVIGVVVVTLGFVGIAYVPNTSDSIVYHLPRVAQWMQQGSVHHFATHYTAQLEFGPLHEFNMLHLHLLTGSDRLDASVQLLAFVVCVVGAAEIARLLGARTEVQVGAAVICAAIPSAVLQATSTVNDLFGAAVGLALFVLVLSIEPHGRWLAPAIGLGLGTGLAVVTKGILPAVIGPALVLLVVRAVLLERQGSTWQRTSARVLAVLSVALIGALAVAGPFLKRNRDLFGSVTGPVSDSTVNELFSVRASAGNVVRSVAVNFRMGDGRSGIDTVVQRWVLGGLQEVYDLLGASQNDPRFVIGALDDAFITGDYQVLSRYEEYSANGWHVALLGLTGVLFVWWAARGDRSARLPALIAIGLTIGFVAFSATARWSLFVARYHLPLLVVWAPLIAIALSRLHRFVLVAVAGFLVVAAMPLVLDNEPRSLLNLRTDFASDIHGYFVHPGGDGYFAAPGDYVAARDEILASGCERVGISNLILLEYPIWAGLEHRGWNGEIKHVDVKNPSGVLEDDNFRPCALLRQAVNRPPSATPPGWIEVPFNGLTLALDPTST